MADEHKNNGASIMLNAKKKALGGKKQERPASPPVATPPSGESMADRLRRIGGKK